MKEYLIPTKRITFILGGILILVLIISFSKFPIGSFMSMNPGESVSFSIGWPVTFFTLDLINPTTMPILWMPLVLSLLSYFIIAYIIDVVISVIISGLTKPATSEEIFIQARKAFYYYRGQGMEEARIKELFKQKGWKDEDLARLNQ